MLPLYIYPQTQKITVEVLHFHSHSHPQQVDHSVELFQLLTMTSVKGMRPSSVSLAHQTHKSH